MRSFSYSFLYIFFFVCKVAGLCDCPTHTRPNRRSTTPDRKVAFLRFCAFPGCPTYWFRFLLSFLVLRVSRRLRAVVFASVFPPSPRVAKRRGQEDVHFLLTGATCPPCLLCLSTWLGSPSYEGEFALVNFSSTQVAEEFPGTQTMLSPRTRSRQPQLASLGIPFCGGTAASLPHVRACSAWIPDSLSPPDR